MSARRKGWAFGLLAVLAAVPAMGAAQTQGWRLTLAGDVMMGTDHGRSALPPSQGRDLFTPAQDVIARADLAIANLEGPIATGGASTKAGCGKCYAFRTPPALAPRLKEAGWDAFSLANNHARDFGDAGRRQTTATLDALGLGWAGTPDQPFVVLQTPDGRRCALVAFATGSAGPRVQDLGRAREIVAQAAQRAQLVVVSFHAGAEGAGAGPTPRGTEFFHGENRGDVRAFARTVVEAGADVVFGHGPHVPRGMELINDRLVAYSLGNFRTFGPFSQSGAMAYSPLLWVQTDAQGRFVRGHLHSYLQQGDGFRADPDRRAAAWVQRWTLADFRSSLRVGADGAVERTVDPPPAVPGDRP